MSNLNLSLALAAGSLFAAPAGAVDLKVPAHFPTIQSAIDAAHPGDDVLVKPGKYDEDLVIDGLDQVGVISGGKFKVRSLRISNSVGIDVAGAACSGAFDHEFVRVENSTFVSLLYLDLKGKVTKFVGDDDMLEVTGVVVEQSHHVFIGDSKFDNLLDGVRMAHSSHVHVLGGVFKHAPIEAHSVIESYVTDSKIGFLTAFGSPLELARNTIKKGAVVFSLSDAGILRFNKLKKSTVSFNGCSDVLVEENKAKKSSLRLLNTHDSLVTGNLISKSPGHGIELSGTSASWPAAPLAL